ncbi:MAG: radical SAM protein [Dysosmobacter sp.]
MAELCLTTNGSLLPELAKPLQEAGVDRLNISLDTLRTERFREITRRGDLEDVLAGIRAAEDAGFQNLKLDTVLMGGLNDDEIEDFLNLDQRAPLGGAVHRADAHGPLCRHGPKHAFCPVTEMLNRFPALEDIEAQWRGPAVPSARSHGDCGADHPQ